MFFLFFMVRRPPISTRTETPSPYTTLFRSQSKSLGVLAITNADKDLYEVNGRTLVSARLGVEAPDGRWAVFGWGRNIFNKYYWTNTIQTYDTVVRYAGRPAEYGLTVRFKF